ncbi:MAG: AAA family ATPase [Phycisphaerales bacterium]|nr:AAA family ATPase [Phycisphaerales bacterium]
MSAARSKPHGEPSAVGGDPVLMQLAHVALDGHLLGQGAALATLSSPLLRGTMPHAWIFHGPHGVGKCTLAVRVAALLVDPETSDGHRSEMRPNTDSRSAQLLRDGVHPDVRVIRKELAADSGDRELRDRKQLNIPLGLLREHLIGGVDSDGRRLDAPMRRSSFLGQAKVFIIDGAEAMEAESQNALLKALEEPPARTFVFLCTTAAERLLPTIRSRCQRVGVVPLSDGEFGTWAATSLAGAAPAELAWIHRFSEGSPGRALLAHKHGLMDWHIQFEHGIEQMCAGRYPTTLADSLHDRAQQYAETIVKENDRASKEAANRAGVSIALSILGESLRNRMHRAAGAAAKPETLEQWISAIESIEEAQRNVRSNVNLKFVFADLVGQAKHCLAHAEHTSDASPIKSSGVRANHAP